MGKQLTVEQLRKAGYRVQIVHRRRYRDHDGGNIYLSNYEANEDPYLKSMWCQGPYMNGGYTKVDITTPDGDMLPSSFAECSENDRFNKKIGLDIALGRAIVRPARQAIKQGMEQSNV